MAEFTFPDHRETFLARHRIKGASFDVPDHVDASGFGAEMTLLSSDEAREEAEECYPGLAVIADGYVPVGACLLGSGDPYFIRCSDGAGGPLYRIHHDAVSWSADEVPRYGPDAIVKVLDSYEALLPHRS